MDSKPSMVAMIYYKPNLWFSIPEDNIDSRLFQVAQYCDAVDPQTGQFIGVDGLADGSFRHKPRGQFTAVKQTLVGIPEGTAIKKDVLPPICSSLINVKLLSTFNQYVGLLEGR